MKTGAGTLLALSGYASACAGAHAASRSRRERAVNCESPRSSATPPGRYSPGPGRRAGESGRDWHIIEYHKHHLQAHACQVLSVARGGMHGALHWKAAAGVLLCSSKERNRCGQSCSCCESQAIRSCRSLFVSKQRWIPVQERCTADRQALLTQASCARCLWLSRHCSMRTSRCSLSQVMSQLISDLAENFPPRATLHSNRKDYMRNCWERSAQRVYRTSLMVWELALVNTLIPELLNRQ